MKFSDAEFLTRGTGNFGDLMRICEYDRINDQDFDSTTLMIALNYGVPKAMAAFAASYESPDNAPYMKHLVFAQELQAEGLIPREVDLISYFAIANSRKIPPESVVLPLVLRGARRTKSSLNTIVRDLFESLVRRYRGVG